MICYNVLCCFLLCSRSTHFPVWVEGAAGDWKQTLHSTRQNIQIEDVYNKQPNFLTLRSLSVITKTKEQRTKKLGLSETLFCFSLWYRGLIFTGILFYLFLPAAFYWESSSYKFMKWSLIYIFDEMKATSCFLDQH